MLNFNKEQSLITLGRTALLVAGVFLSSAVYAASSIDELEAALLVRINSEQAARIAEDDSLRTKISAETGRAVAAEGALSDRINSEQAARIAEDNSLRTKISTETGRAIAAEKVLSDAIGDRNINSLNKEINEATRDISLSAGLQEAGRAIGNMAFNNTRYISKDGDLSSAVRTLDANINRIENHFNGQINRLENKLDKHHHEMKRGFASLAAMTRLVPNPRACGDTQISVGVGHYHGSTGVAIGAFHYIDNNTLVNVGVGYSGHDSATFGVGLTFGF